MNASQYISENGSEHPTKISIGIEKIGAIAETILDYIRIINFGATLIKRPIILKIIRGKIEASWLNIVERDQDSPPSGEVSKKTVELNKEVERIKTKNTKTVDFKNLISQIGLEDKRNYLYQHKDYTAKILLIES